VAVKEPSIDRSKPHNISDEIAMSEQQREFREELAVNGLVINLPEIDVFEGKFIRDSWETRHRPVSGENGLWLGFNPLDVPEDQRQHFSKDLFSGEYDRVWVSGSYAKPVVEDPETKQAFEDLYRDRWVGWQQG
jgi:hypothetical protein